jgi:hypothetical protein
MGTKGGAGYRASPSLPQASSPRVWLMKTLMPADQSKGEQHASDVRSGGYAVEYGYRRRQTIHASHTLGALLVVMMLASLVSGCSLYASGRALIEQPLETIECFPECPFYTEPIFLRHPGSGIIVECGPYPYALYSSMAAGYRAERQQCVAHYQWQGYVRLATTAGKSR